MAVQKAKGSKCWKGVKLSGTLCIVGGMDNGAAAMDNSLAAAQKVKHKITI